MKEWNSDMIEYYHDSGLMPDWAYYMQNGKSATENLFEQINKHKERADDVSDVHITAEVNVKR